jgi:hypothetical protein
MWIKALNFFAAASGRPRFFRSGLSSGQEGNLGVDRQTSAPVGDAGWKPSASLTAVVGEMASLGLLAGVVHGLALIFVFPGFYAPTLFDHSDFYIPLALFHGSLGFLSTLSWPRPVGTAYLYATGALGLQGSVLATLGLIFFNVTSIEMIVRRACQLELTIPFFVGAAAFDLLIFAQPFFFTFAIHDALAQVSFFFLCLAFVLIVVRPSVGLPELVAFGVLSLCAFLAKETYAVSAVWLAFVIGYARRRGGIATAFTPALVVVVAFAAAAAYNLRVNSPFIAGPSDPHAPYSQTHNIWIVFSQFRNYIDAGLPLAIIGLLLSLFIVCCIFLPQSRMRWAALALPVAGIAAMLPNSVLPNHYFPGYSWDMGYLLFAPVLLLPNIARTSGLARGAVAVLVLACAAMLPHFLQSRYASNAWSLAEATILRNMDRSLDVLTAASGFGPDHRRVLVTGLPPPFSPFDNGTALRAWTGRANVQFDVVSYARVQQNNGPVHFVEPASVSLKDYTDIWAFSAKGTGQQITSIDNLASLDGLGALPQILYPFIRDILAAAHPIGPERPPDAGQLIACGAKLIEYHAYDLAIRVLKQAEAAAPGSPYPPFFLAKVYEAQGRMQDAVQSAEQAVAKSKGISADPSFDQLFDRLRRVAKAN